ncbi:MAG: PEP-CTERM sorting domain-containing protein [Planctomycetia bacterium]
MRSFKSFAVAVAAALTAVVFSVAIQPAKADLVFIFDESTPGTIVVRGSGSVNTTALGAPNHVFTGPFTLNPGNIWNDSFQMSGETAATANAWLTDGSGGGDFDVIQGADYFYSGNANAPSGPATGSYMELSPNPALSTYISLNGTYVSGSPLSNTTTLTGFTRADFGYNPLSTWANPTLEGTWTLHNIYTGAATGETISIYSVPEPSTMLMLAGAGVGFGAWRLRKLRRSRPAAGEAVAG